MLFFFSSFSFNRNISNEVGGNVIDHPLKMVSNMKMATNSNGNIIGYNDIVDSSPLYTIHKTHFVIHSPFVRLCWKHMENYKGWQVQHFQLAEKFFATDLLNLPAYRKSVCWIGCVHCRLLPFIASDANDKEDVEQQQKIYWNWNIKI